MHDRSRGSINESGVSVPISHESPFLNLGKQESVQTIKIKEFYSPKIDSIDKHILD